MTSYQYASKLEGDLTDLQADVDHGLPRPPPIPSSLGSSGSLTPGPLALDTDSQRTVIQTHEFPPLTSKSPSPSVPLIPREKIEPFQSLPLSEDALRPLPKSGKDPLVKRKRASKWIQLRLWFNTYRKFWTFVVTLNVLGGHHDIGGAFPLRSSISRGHGSWELAYSYPDEKRSIWPVPLSVRQHPIRKSEHPSGPFQLILTSDLVDTALVASRVHFRASAPGWHSLGLRNVWVYVANTQRPGRFPKAQTKSQRCFGSRRGNKCCRYHQHYQRLSLG